MSAGEPYDDDLRIFADALKDESVWDQRPLREEPVPQTIATLRAFANRMAGEDAQAEVVLRALLAGSRETWMLTLRQHPEYRTAGVVRKPIAASARAIDTMPPDAVVLTALATEIADHLEPAAYPTDTIPRLRGAAWRERAYALFYTGAFADAETALRASESHFSDCAVEEYEMARVGIVRALVERAMERSPSAVRIARESATTFARFEDRTRMASASLAVVHMLFTAADYKTAYTVLCELEEQLQHSSDTDTHARVLGNLGYCCWKLGKADEALRYHEAAAMLLDHLNIRTEALRAKWSIASILASQGRLDEARERLSCVGSEFERLGMTNVAALVDLEIAELLLACGEYNQVEAICHKAMQSFEAAGLSHTARAQTALAYMREAARERTVTPVLVRHVREYLRRLPHEENLLFLPPPG